MSQDTDLLSTEQKERITSEAAERGVEPEEHLRTLLKKGRQFDAVSRSRDRLMDEIRRARSGTKEAEDITLPNE